jgi:tryptophanyl-tRNA synthetase
MRPTGKLHLGNLHGALSNWIALQNHGAYDCYYFVADWHALTSDYAATGEIRANTVDMVIDWLAAGLDHEKSTLFIQSMIKEHAELFVLLSMITPLAWLERNPTYKEMKEELTQKDLSTFGFLGYPVLQAADIIMYKAFGVPVGVDQLPHVELTREIARRFNFLYGEIFPIPEPLLTEVPKLLGIDGRKMSKSYDNAIFISDQGEALSRKVAAMFTDPQRQRKKDPGRPQLCNVFTFQGLYSPSERVAQIESACRQAAIGCTECKRQLAAAITEGMRPIHERRDYYVAHPEEIRTIIAEGNERAAAIARATLAEVRDALKISHEL